MILSLLETRVLGTLVEKQHTVPDSYPLTLNALVSGCNQKSSRSPVIEATESEVQAALDSLKAANLVIESSGGRVSRYSHNLERVLQVPSQSAALLTSLMLRGPQTAGELRTNCDRMHSFADISAVQGFLDELAARPAGALVVELPRLPGARENRWAHLLSGAPAVIRIVNIDHVVLRVRDMEAMRRFYCDVLGAEHVAYRPKFKMSHLRVGAALIDLVVADKGAGGSNMDHLCLRVEPFDQDAIVSHLKAHGVAVGDIRNRYGSEGNGISIYLTDPEGNMVELKGPSDGKAPPD